MQGQRLRRAGTFVVAIAFLTLGAPAAGAAQTELWQEGLPRSASEQAYLDALVRHGTWLATYVDDSKDQRSLEHRLRGASAEAAIAALRNHFSDFLGGNAQLLDQLPAGAKIEGFAGDYRARIRLPGKKARGLLLSSAPLRAEKLGHKRRVDLGVEQTAEGFAPVNGLVPVSFPRDLRNGFRAGARGRPETTLTPLSLSGGVGRPRVVRRSVVYPNAYPDTDIILQSTTFGMRLALQIRSAKAPTTFNFSLRGDRDMQATQAGNGVSIARSDGTTLNLDPPGVADRHGRGIGHRLEAAGDTITIRADHADQNYAYPVLLETKIQLGSAKARSRDAPPPGGDQLRPADSGYKRCGTEEITYTGWDTCYDFGGAGEDGGWKTSEVNEPGFDAPKYKFDVSECARSKGSRGLCIRTTDFGYQGGFGEYRLGAPPTTYFTWVRFEGQYHENERVGYGQWPDQCARVALYSSPSDKWVYDTGFSTNDGAYQGNGDYDINRTFVWEEGDPTGDSAAVFRLHACGRTTKDSLKDWDAYGRLDVVEAYLTDETEPTNGRASGPLWDLRGQTVSWSPSIKRSVTIGADDVGSGMSECDLYEDEEGEELIIGCPLELNINGEETSVAYAADAEPGCDDTHSRTIQPCGKSGDTTIDFYTDGHDDPDGHDDKGTPSDPDRTIDKGWNDVCVDATDYAQNTAYEMVCWRVQFDGRAPGKSPLSVEAENGYAKASWTAVGDEDGSQAHDTGAGLKYYEYRYKIGGGPFTDWTRTTDRKAPLLSGLSPGAKVTYQVRTVDNVDNVSPDTEIQEATATAKAQPVLGRRPTQTYETGGERFLAEELTTNLSQGSLLAQRSDLDIPSKGPDATFARTYNSAQNKRGGILGYGWRASIETHLTELPDQSVLYDDGQGSLFRFYADGKGGYRHIPGIHLTLVKEGSTFKLADTAHNTQSFDAEGKLASLDDQNGNALTYTYNGQDQLTAITDASGRQTTLAYDVNGRLGSLTDPAQRVTTYTYTADNLLRSVANPAGEKTCFAYDSEGRLARTAAPDLVEKVGCDAITAEDEGTAKGEAVITYDAQGRVSSLTNEEHWSDGTRYGASALYTYSCRGSADRVCVRSPSSDTYAAEYRLSATGQATSQKDEGARTIVNTYNGDFHPIKIVTDAGGRNTLTTMGWTPSGRLAWRKEPGDAQPTRYAYRNDNLTQVTSPLGKKTAYTYDEDHNLNLKTEGAGTPDALTSDYNYDGAGNLTEVTDAQGRTTHLTHDDYGNVTSVTDPGAATPALTFAYDQAGQRSSATDASGNSSTFSRLQNGKIDSQTDRRAGGDIAQTADLGYNKSGALTDQADRATDEQGTVTQATQATVLDPFVKQSSFAVGQGNDQQTPIETHSPHGLSTVRTQHRITHEHNTDVVGRPYDFVYHNSSALLEVREQETDDIAALYSYDGNWNITRNERDADGATVVSTFAPNSDIEIRRQAASGRGIYFDQSYAVNNDDQLVQVVDRQSGEATTYTYTAAGKLRSELRGQKTTTYSYDNAGQRTRKVDPDGTTTYAYNDQGQLSEEQAPGGTKTYTYDANGNLISVKGPDGTTSYTWDSQSRLTKAQLPDRASVTFTYQDQTNLRLAKKVYDRFGRLDSFTQYVYDPTQENLVAELDATERPPAVKAVYNRGPLGEPISVTLGPDTSSPTYYYNLTPKGHVLALSNSFGDTSPGATYSYDAFGNLLFENEDLDGFNNPLRFRGAIYDKETGLYYLKNRYYDPRSGLYISPDPGRAALPVADRYAYAQGDPVNGSEPDGTFLSLRTDDPGPFERPLARGYQPLPAVSTLTAQEFPALGCGQAAYVKTPMRRDPMLQVAPSQSDLPLASGADDRGRPCPSG